MGSVTQTCAWARQGSPNDCNKKTNANDYLGVPSCVESVAQPLAVRMDHCHCLWTWSVRKINTNWANAGSNNAITIILLSVTL